MQRSQSADNDSDPGSILGTSTHELQVIPLGGVASMISSVVNQSASMAASTAGGKVPQARSTFGKRNIKNQVRKFDKFLKESRRYRTDFLVLAVFAGGRIGEMKRFFCSDDHCSCLI